jgi:hypothetical protein
MKMRGIQKQNRCTVTSALLGKFRDDFKTRLEFLWDVFEPNSAGTTPPTGLQGFRLVFPAIAFPRILA